jgi:uncharacterized protein
MPIIEKHAPGTFCLVELATTDQDAAKTFYTQLFGWSSLDHPMGPNRIYTMFRIQDRDVASAYTMWPQMLEQGIPPHWDLYITVENADETAARAKELGAKIFREPFDVMEFGRMAVIQDPTGAVFCIWQPKAGIGIQLGGVPGTLCWADLSSPDADRAKTFYEKLFGWAIVKGEHDDSGYLHIKNGDQFIGGVLPANLRNPNTPPHWMAYFVVENTDAATAKVHSLGGRTYMPPTDIPNAGRFSIVADPQGAAFALFQPVPQS